MAKRAKFDPAPLEEPEGAFTDHSDTLAAEPPDTSGEETADAQEPAAEPPVRVTDGTRVVAPTAERTLDWYLRHGWKRA